MLPSDRSSGVATLEAMISGLAPGRLACTVITGKSMFGSGDTGSRQADPTAAGSRAEQHGRHRAGDKRGGKVHACPARLQSGSRLRLRQRLATAPEALAEAVEEEVDHRCGEQRQQLTEQQAAPAPEPSGWRSSAPEPDASISGIAPNSAARVVIRIGRKRSSAAR